MKISPRLYQHKENAMPKYEAALILVLAACGVWQVQKWLMAGLIRFQQWFEQKYGTKCRSECYEGGTGGRVHYCGLAKGHSGDCKWELVL